MLRWVLFERTGIMKSYIAIRSSSIVFFIRTPCVPKSKYMVSPAEVPKQAHGAQEKESPLALD